MKSKKQILLIMYLFISFLLFMQASCGTAHAEISAQQSLFDLAERTVGNVYFISGSPSVADVSGDEIRKIATIMEAAPQVTAVVEGYTGPSGKKSINLKLCKSRTENVKKYLIEKFHVDESRVMTVECTAEPGMATSAYKVKKLNKKGRVQIMLLSHRLETPVGNPEEVVLWDNFTITAQKIIVKGSGESRAKDQKSGKMAALMDGLRNFIEGISSVKYWAVEHRANPKQGYIEYEIERKYDSLVRKFDVQCRDINDKKTLKKKCGSSFSGWHLSSETIVKEFAVETDKVTLTHGKVKIVLSDFQLVSDASLKYFEDILSLLGEMGFEISYNHYLDGTVQAELTCSARTK